MYILFDRLQLNNINISKSFSEKCLKHGLNNKYMVFRRKKRYKMYNHFLGVSFLPKGKRVIAYRIQMSNFYNKN